MLFCRINTKFARQNELYTDNIFDETNKNIYYINMKQWLFFPVIIFLASIFIMASSCETVPPPAEPVAQVQQPAAASATEPSPAEPVVIQRIVSQEVYDATKIDIQQLVQDLNGIIRARNYNRWLTYLTDSYRERIGSREFLEDIRSRYPAFRGRLNSAQDYFNLVVVPSRANDHVDDIEFVTENHVVAYTIDSHNQRLILYNLVDVNGVWKIDN